MQTKLVSRVDLPMCLTFRLAFYEEKLTHCVVLCQRLADVVNYMFESIFLVSKFHTVKNTKEVIIPHLI